MNLRGMSILRGLLRNERGCVGSPSIHRRILTFLRSGDDGSALVELAIALPVYLIIITGMISTVMALYAYEQLAFACFTASEAVAGDRGSQTDPCAVVAASVTNSLPTWTAANFTYTVWITENVAGTVSSPQQFGPYTGTTAATCTGSASTPGNGYYAWFNSQDEPVTVRVQYVYKWFPIYSDQITTGNLTVAETSLVR
jgi:Flp pilus assembly protein TadG